MAVRDIPGSRLLAVALVALGAACASSRAEPGEVGDMEMEATLVVENQTLFDATITLVGPSGLRRRLGVVTSNSRRQFSFRWPDPSVQVEARIPGGDTYLTPRMSVVAGDVLDFTLERRLFRR